MSADLLREAAALMRSRAEAATPGRRGYDAWNHIDGTWSVVTHDESMHDIAVYGGSNVPPPDVARDVDAEWEVERRAQARSDAAFDVSSTPAFVLRVAEWLDREAADAEREGLIDLEAFAVATTYLGRTS